MRTLFLTILAATALMLGGVCEHGRRRHHRGDVAPHVNHVNPSPGDRASRRAWRTTTLTFNDDGTFDAKADCNQVSGTYTIVDASVLTHDTRGHQPWPPAARGPSAPNTCSS